MLKQQLKNLKFVKHGNSTGLVIPVAFSKNGTLVLGKRYNIEIQEVDYND